MLSFALSPQSENNVDYMSRVPYSSAVGYLMYAMICSHPDLSYVVSVVSRYMANLSKEHWKAVQWIFRYLCGSSDVCLHFGRTRDGVIGYVDYDFVGDFVGRLCYQLESYSTDHDCVVDYRGKIYGYYRSL